VSVLDQLVEDSKRNISAMASTVLPRLTLSAADARELVTYIETHPDRSAYHPLLALRRAARAEYDRLPAATKAAVLCAALTHLGNLNDYGYLDPGDTLPRAARRRSPSGAAVRERRRGHELDVPVPPM
jgi:hypothetical protein